MECFFCFIIYRHWTILYWFFLHRKQWEFWTKMKGRICTVSGLFSTYNVFFKRHSVFRTNKNCPYFNAERLKIHRYHNSRTHDSFLIYIMALFFLIAQLAFPFLLQGRFCHAYILVSLAFPFILVGRMLYSVNYKKVWLLSCAILDLKYEK